MKNSEKPTHLFSIMISISSLMGMLDQMLKKNLDLSRITKVASLLILSGVSYSSIDKAILNRCIAEQNADGGWISIPDTIWNTLYLKLSNDESALLPYEMGCNYLINNKNKNGLWGRGIRDVSRIPVTGIIMNFLPELVTQRELELLEELWISEKNSLTYKAGYTLIAFKATHYTPKTLNLIEETMEWLIENQRKDGGFAPWKDHPIESNVYCTSIACLGLIAYSCCVPKSTIEAATEWLVSNQLKSGIWKYHEIEDGASWGLLCLSMAKRYSDQ